MAGVYKWSTIDRLCNTAITMAGNIALARLLSPADFGLLAMVQIFWALAFNFSNCGMCDGLIKKLRPSDADYSTVFTFNSATGLLFCVFFLASSNLVARFFGQEALRNIMWAIGVCFFFQSLCLVQETRLRKELQMKKIALVRIAASLTSVSLGIYLAAAGYGYWGLVATRIFLSFFLFIYYMIATRWMPRIAFHIASFREMFSYGVNLMLAYLATQISMNINTMALGKVSSSRSGIFSQAQKMEDVPYRLIESIFNWPFFAVISNEPDPERRRVLARDMLSTISLIAIAGGMLMMILASPVFLLLFGEKWEAAIPVFRILTLYGLATTLKYFFQTILKSHGKTNIVRNLTVLEVVIQLSLLIIFFSRGIIWIAWTQVSGVALSMILYVYYFCRLQKESLHSTLKAIFSNLWVPAIAFVLTAAAYWFWNAHIAPWANALAVISLFLGVCILLWECFPCNPYLDIRKVLIGKIKKSDK